MARPDGGRPIGEVLEELREDFPGVSVSKIRFLEAQGLINPQRTPAGYRQFTDDDVALLRWILRQQRDHYLPLKVIRRRLREGDGPHAPAAGEPAGSGAAASGSPPATSGAPPAAWYLDEAAPEPAGPPPLALDGPGDEELWSAAAGRPARYSRVEVGEQSGLDERALAELESFGLLPPGGDLDGEALTVARVAARFFGYGVEARHLRMYKHFAEREAAFLEQVVAPIVNSRADDGKERAREALADLARLGQALRLSMLRSAFGSAYGD